MATRKADTKRTAVPSRDVSLARGTESRESDRLIGDLKQLGFSDYEAKTYLTLLDDFPATAYEVGKKSGLQKPNVYSAFVALERLGAVQAISSNPVRFVPVDPKIVLDVISRRTAKLCSDIVDRLEDKRPALKQDFAWILSGEDSVDRRIDEIIANAQTHVWIKAHETHLLRHIDGLRAASGRGVKLLLIVFGSTDPFTSLDLGPNAEIFLHEGSGTIVGLGKSLVTVTADFSVALTANFREEVRGALTQNASLVMLAESLIRHEVYLAEIFRYYGEPITERFGPFLRHLRGKYLPLDQAAELEVRIREQASLQGSHD